MNIDISFPAEIESRLRRTAAAAGTDVGDFVKQIVTERLPESEPEAEIRLDHAIDDSRESFFTGRE